MVVFDKEKQKLLEFRSKNDFDINVAQDLLSSEIRCQFKYELFSNTHGENGTTASDEPLYDENEDKRYSDFRLDVLKKKFLVKTDEND